MRAASRTDGQSAAKSGQKRTSLDAMLLLKDLKQHPIYPELIAIGGKDMTMRADALLKYDHLLAAPEVRRRAGSKTDRATLSQCANEALRDAIASIVSTTTQEVAEAALCATDTFVSLKIFERVHKLPADIDERKFKYQRELAFKKIIEYLTRDVSPTTPDLNWDNSTVSGPRQVTEKGSAYLEAFTHLAERAAVLHYAGLGALFAYDFDDELCDNHIPVSWLDPLIPRTTLSQYLFTSYITFVYNNFFAHLYLKNPIAEESPERFPQRLPAHATDLLLSLCQRIAGCSPVGPHGFTDDSRLAFNASVPLGFDEAEVREAYETKWRPWCCGHTPAGVIARSGPGTKNHFVEAVTPMTAASGAVIHVLAENLPLNVPIHAHGRLMAHKALANSYQFDEWAPILDGKSLRYRTDVYFDLESTQLTNQALK
jgi:hypothetical protein